ncbi:type I methionyl aminopeptidase [Syntrophomonas palmitatica]|uniref:type I methionyl aminopeptidase n=1 Tax=Syntrophomonas palmitatica TaxID=402877 RepID=UPI0006D0923A|nr:type I methionyl aminopeptidase [Syntrophomonas palmitatica]
MIILKTPDEIKIMRAAGLAVAQILKRLEDETKVGITTGELNAIAEAETQARGAVPLFKNYPNSKPGARPFPGAICASINEEVVHGIPGDRKLKEGDIISIDFGLLLDGFCGDAAVTIPVGKVSAKALKLVKTTEQALMKGIAQAKIGNRLGAVGNAVQSYAEKHSYSVVREFVGHGIGRDMHEAPPVPNYGRADRGPALKAGMTIAIEPMVNEGGHGVYTKADDWTVVTKDGSLSAHFEHTVAITERGPIILTSR